MNSLRELKLLITVNEAEHQLKASNVDNALVRCRCHNNTYLLRPTHKVYPLSGVYTYGMQTRLQTGLQTGVSSVYTERLVCVPTDRRYVYT